MSKKKAAPKPQRSIVPPPPEAQDAVKKQQEELDKFYDALPTPEKFAKLEATVNSHAETFKWFKGIFFTVAIAAAIHFEGKFETISNQIASDRNAAQTRQLLREQQNRDEIYRVNNRLDSIIFNDAISVEKQEQEKEKKPTKHTK